MVRPSFDPFCNKIPAHIPGNATTGDLWGALSNASGQDVDKFMVEDILLVY